MGKLIDDIKRLPVKVNDCMPKWAQNEEMLEAIDNWIQGGYVSQVFPSKTELYHYLRGQSQQYPREPIWSSSPPASRTFLEFLRKRTADVSRKSAQERYAGEIEGARGANSGTHETA